MIRFPSEIQKESKDCGPTCLRIVARYYKKSIPIQELRDYSETTREGSNLMGLSDAAEKVGFRTLGVKLSYGQFKEEMPLPCIVHWNKNHFAVVYKIKKDTIYVSDPAMGLLKYGKEEFLEHWIGEGASSNTVEGIGLIVEPTPKFHEQSYDQETRYGLRFITKYLFQYKRLIVQLLLGLVVSSCLQLIAPFLTQSIVDTGIQNQDLPFIYLILVGQLFLFFGRTAIEMVRSWIILHISSRINIALLSDFFIKLMNLPISYFDVRLHGDVLQRVNDHKRIEQILTVSTLDVIFSTINLVIFGFVLAWYSLKIFVVFAVGSVLYFLWIIFFLKRREILDYKRFSQQSQEQGTIIDLIGGMQEIKMHNAERKKRWAWEHLQARLFKLSIQRLALEQYQSVGSGFINELKNILISVLSATLVIEGEITLGMMLAISYIVGQLNAPVTQLISFTKEIQDARISVDRLGEIHNKADERETDKSKTNYTLPDQDIHLNNISYRYAGSDRKVLNEVNLTIPANKITAIVGVSGSGKTTLLKVLLQFYQVQGGSIHYGATDLNAIAQRHWRDKCGAVMQESFIFNDTIANNVAVGDTEIDKAQLIYALEVANILDFVQSLPHAYNTPIGASGLGLSTGQKQRLMIARVIYKNPDILLFDEATSSLDANNEKTIMENLDRLFVNKTVVIIAHRLSTVKNADQIVVLDQGKIDEIGTHQELIAKRGNYYQLVKNQLELGT